MGTLDDEFDWAEGPGGDVPDEPPAVGSAGLGARQTALSKADEMDDDPASFAFDEHPDADGEDEDDADVAG